MKALTAATQKLIEPVRGLSQQDRLHISLASEGDAFVAQFYQPPYYSGGVRSFPSAAAQRLSVRFPERKLLSGLCDWQFAATDVTAHLVDSLWPKSQLEIEPDANLLMGYLLLSSAQHDRNAETTARYKEFAIKRLALVKAGLDARTIDEAMGHASVLSRGYHMHPELPLALYQQVALHNAYHSEGYAFFKEQGAGKTPPTIALIENLRLAQKDGRCLKMLVVAPKNVRANWAAEFERFGTLNREVTVLRGGEIERTKLFIDAMVACKTRQYSVVVCSYETMTRSLRLLQSVQWDLAVLDEAHYIKAPESQRSKASRALRDHCSRRLILTGSPIANTPLDLYAQLEFLGRGWSGFMSFQEFKNFYGVYFTNAQGRKQLCDVQNLPFMQERLARLSIIVTKKEAMPDLPELLYDVIEVEMTEEQRGLYKQLSENLYAEVERDLQDESKNKQLVVNSVLTKLLRLAQITSGFIPWDAVYSDDGEVLSASTIDRFDPNPKVEALVEELKCRQREELLSKTIVWAHWRQDIRTISARLESEGIRHVVFYGATGDEARAEAEWAFNHDADCTVFVGSAGAGGTGLNLLGYPPGQGDEHATNCDWVVYFSQDWSSLKRVQSEARPHRRGTRVNVRVSDLCVPNTIDEEIRARVVNKRNVAATISDVRELLKRALRGPTGD